MKDIKSRLAESDPERAAIFESKAPAIVKKILGNIKDYEFYVGESMNPEGAVGLLNYREDGMKDFPDV
jgi:hypothetical protein